MDITQKVVMRRAARLLDTGKLGWTKEMYLRDEMGNALVEEEMLHYPTRTVASACALGACQVAAKQLGLDEPFVIAENISHDISEVIFKEVVDFHGIVEYNDHIAEDGHDAAIALALASQL